MKVKQHTLKGTSAPTLLSFSEKYDRRHAQAYFEKHQDGFWRKLSNWRDQYIGNKALKLAGDPKSVLDMPCGTGRFWDLLAQDPDRDIIACDYSQDMIDIGLRLRHSATTERIRTVQSSAFALDLPDEVVETVFCIRLLHHIGRSDDRLTILREMHRVSRASVIVSVWVDGNVKAWRRQRLEAKRVKRAYQNRFVIPRNVIENEFQQAGFTIKARLDLLPKYAMWRTYVLEKAGS